MQGAAVRLDERWAVAGWSSEKCWAAELQVAELPWLPAWAAPSLLARLQTRQLAQQPWQLPCPVQPACWSVWLETAGARREAHGYWVSLGGSIKEHKRMHRPCGIILDSSHPPAQSHSPHPPHPQTRWRRARRSQAPALPCACCLALLLVNKQQGVTAWYMLHGVAWGLSSARDT